MRASRQPHQLAHASRTIYLVGPTAVGKTAVALELASLLDAEIISADSMQVYRGLDIGTAKPTAAELARVRHHLVDVCEPTELFDVHRFVGLASAACRQIHQQQRTALVVGGTGLYVRALRHGLFAGPGRDDALRQRLEKLSTAELAAELDRLDPQTSAQIDRQNPRRLIRALEVWHTSGQSITNLQQQWTETDAADPGPIFGLCRDRAELIGRIESRIDQQMADGWLAEVQRLRSQAAGQPLTAWQAAGYREFNEHLEGRLRLAEAVALVKIRTRQLAKRQITWFRREPGLRWLPLNANDQPQQTAQRLWKLIQETSTRS